MTCARARPATSQRAHDVFPPLLAGAEPEAHARSKGKPLRQAALQCSERLVPRLHVKDAEVRRLVLRVLVVIQARVYL